MSETTQESPRPLIERGSPAEESASGVEKKPRDPSRWNGALKWASRVLLLSLLAVYLVSFGRANWGMLADPALQNDDARTILFPFHAYGSAGTLGDDPIANEMLSLVPWGVRILYFAFVPIVDVYVASKLVQMVALGILLWAFVVMARSKRTGWGAAALLVFFVLHTTFAVDRIGGGLPRAFGFPCFALWLAGILSHNRVARFSAPVILALTYPSVMNMILAAEGLLAVRGAFRIPWSVWGRRLRRYAALVGVCFVCVLPAAVGNDERGPIHTLEQAKKEPAFGKRGRLWILPFANPVDAMGKAFMNPVTPAGTHPIDALAGVKKDKEMVAMLVLAFFLLIPSLRLNPAPAAGAAFFAGTTIIYAISRSFAFTLYSPERYYSFGMRMACLAVVVSCTAQLFYWVRSQHRETVRNFVAFVLIGALWMVLGDGLKKDTGMTINAKRDQELYEYIRRLPPDSKFAAHILDGDGIPLWGARAHTGSFETLQPWFTKSWARQKKRTLDTLEALYATDKKTILEFAKRYGVTHILVNRSRFGRAVHSKAGSFEPFSTEVREMLRGKKPAEFYFNKPPKEAVIFKKGRFRIVSIEKLKTAKKQKKRKRGKRPPKK